MMTKWEIARYLIDAKKNIDTIQYIADNQHQFPYINIRHFIDKTMHEFYINCVIVLDKSFPGQKGTLKQDAVLNAIYYERDKDSAHKDDNYNKTPFQSLYEIINIMKERIEKVLYVCSAHLPQNITLDYLSFDGELFRLVNGVTKDVEEEILRDKHPFRCAKPSIIIPSVEIKIFNDTEDYKNIKNDSDNQYGVMFEDGLTIEEGLQKRQDSIIRANLLFGHDSWVTITRENLNKQKHYREIGLYDKYDRPIVPQNKDEQIAFLELLKKEGLLDD